MTRRVLNLAWPSVAEQSLITLVGLVDTYIVGHLGAEAIAGVGLGGQILNLIAALFGALGIGATAVVARSIGARNRDEAAAVAGQGVLIALAIGLLSSGIAFAFARPIITLFGGAPGVVVQGTAWLRAAGPSFALMGLMLVGNAIMRGAGDTRTPLLVMIASNVINVVTAWTLTRGMGMGVIGAGIGVTVGHLIGGLLVLIILFSRRYSLSLSNLQPDLAYIERILNVGLPAGGEQIILQLALSYQAALISVFGTAAYAAHQIAIRVTALSYLPGWGFSVATTTLVGQELGAKNPDGAREAVSVARRFSLLVMAGMGVALFLFAEPIVRIFTPDPEVIRAGAWAIRVAAFIQPLMSQSFIYGGALRGAGDTRSTMVITMSTVWGLRILATYLLGYRLGLGLVGAWLSVGLDFAFRWMLFALRFRTGKWALLRV
ncbi:MAG: MATE family efflux transporter [Chloroflexi bacterium]|nr:MATE family efflux transporter [Chloroflexota bacterium]